MQELKLKDEQCEKLSRVRNELEAELEDLTASLFQVCSGNLYYFREAFSIMQKYTNVFCIS